MFSWTITISVQLIPELLLHNTFSMNNFQPNKRQNPSEIINKRLLVGDLSHATVARTVFLSGKTDVMCYSLVHNLWMIQKIYFI